MFRSERSIAIGRGKETKKRKKENFFVCERKIWYILKKIEISIYISYLHQNNDILLEF